MPEELREWSQDTLSATLAGLLFGGGKRWMDERGAAPPQAPADAPTKLHAARHIAEENTQVGGWRLAVEERCLVDRGSESCCGHRPSLTLTPPPSHRRPTPPNSACPASPTRPCAAGCTLAAWPLSFMACR